MEVRNLKNHFCEYADQTPLFFCLLLFRFSCATREGQTSAQFNFHGEHRVWDGRTIKRKVQGGSALYLVLEDEVHTMYKTIITPFSFKAYCTLDTSGFRNFSFSLLSGMPLCAKPFVKCGNIYDFLNQD